MSKFIVGNPETNFFEQNPEIRYFSQVNSLVAEVGKEKASTLMWAVYLTEDPRSKFYKMEKQLRLVEIATNYLQDPKFDWNIVKDVVNAYPRMCLNKEQAMFKIWADKMDEALTFLKILKFDEEDVKILRIMTNVGKMWATYDLVKKKMIESESKDQLRGGATKSYKERRSKSK